MPHSQGGRRDRTVGLFLAGALFLAERPTPGVQAQGNVNVWTYHNDNARTGQNLNETVLTFANVGTSTFGKLFDFPVDGYVYAQPLYLSGVQIPGQGTHNIVFIATEHDSVYAFDADRFTGTPPLPLWQVSLIDAGAGESTVPIDDYSLSDPPEEGITGTPVIDSASGTLFVVAKVKNNRADPPTYAHRLYALDVATGTAKFGGPVEIQASVAGYGDGSDGSGNVPFDSFHEFQRPGLLLLDGVVYLTFASQGDIDPYHGWVLGYDARTLQQVSIFNDTPNGSEGGIWMSGAAPAADNAGNIYLMTGNGTFDAYLGSDDFGDSFLKLSASRAGLNLTDYFTPYNQAWMQQVDGDLGSGAPLLLPDAVGNETHPHLLVGAGKQGTIYLVDRDNMGHYNPQADTQIVQELFGALGQGCFSMAAYFNGAVYYLGFNDVLKAFSLASGQLSTKPIMQAGVQFGYPGATPSISANGTNSAIVWAIRTDAFGDGGPAVLYAYNATNLAQELYDSSQAGIRDQMGLAQKFAVPTIANGKVYVGTGFAVAVFGTLTIPVITTSPQDQTVVAGTSVTLTVEAAGNPPLFYQWRLNGTNLPAGEGPSLTLTNVQAGDAGLYTVTVGNQAGEVTSDPAQLTVLPPTVLQVAWPGTLKLQGAAGQNYLIEYADTLASSPYWAALTTLNLTNALATVFDADATNQAQRFYRALYLPSSP